MQTLAWVPDHVLTSQGARPTMDIVIVLDAQQHLPWVEVQHFLINILKEVLHWPWQIQVSRAGTLFPLQTGPPPTHGRCPVWECLHALERRGRKGLQEGPAAQDKSTPTRAPSWDSLGSSIWVNHCPLEWTPSINKTLISQESGKAAESCWVRQAEN